MADKSKQEVVFTPVPALKKISEMTREELLDFVRAIRGAVTPKN